MERQGLVTFKGQAMTLEGNPIGVGDRAPDFTAINLEMQPVEFKQFKERNVLISSVASVDTPVCEVQTRRVNQEAEQLDHAVMLTISMDLPFAQKRFMKEHGIVRVQMLSDFKNHEFGRAFGLYVKELGLLARAVLVIDKTGQVVYEEIVKEITEQPDYARAFAEVKKLK